MSFDDLFALILFVVFIAMPALSRLARSRQQGPPGAPPGAPGRPPVPGTGRASTAAGPATARRAEVADPASDLEQRLAEARERVRRAMGGDASASTGPSGSATPATAPVRTPAAPAARPASTSPRPAPRPTPFGRRLVAGDRDDGLLSTPLSSADVASLGRERPAAARPTSRSTRFAEAPALQVERTVRAGSVALPASAGFPTDPATVRSALIWHQVLGEPRARRPLGGRSSTLRSR